MNINQQIAIKGAELLWPKYNYRICGASCVELIDFDDIGEIGRGIFDPVNNGTDMNKLIEALKIDVTFSFEANSWEGMYYTEGFDFVIIEQNESRDEAIRECVIKALGLHNDSEALGVDND